MKDGTLTCTLGASPKFSWEQSVTYLAHFKKHCKTSLAEYCGGGGGVHRRSRYLSDYEASPLQALEHAGGSELCSA